MEGYCESCGDQSRLFEAITGEGVKSLCRRCLRLGNYPLINKISKEQLKNRHKFSGSHKATPIPRFEKERSPEIKAMDKKLSGMILERISHGNYGDLVDNFHWHIQYSRRRKKLSHKQVSEYIAEPEILIVEAEKGKLPEDYARFINKLEQFLGIRIRKNPIKLDGIENGNFNINKADLMSVTTEDLRNMQENKSNDSYNDEIDIIDFDEED